MNIKHNENHEGAVSVADFVEKYGDEAKELATNIEGQGWSSILGRSPLATVDLPEGWESLEVTAMFVEDVHDRWVFDTNRIEVYTQMWGRDNLPDGKDATTVVTELDKAGWRYIDGNIARTSYYREK